MKKLIVAIILGAVLIGAIAIFLIVDKEKIIVGSDDPAGIIFHGYDLSIVRQDCINNPNVCDLDECLRLPSACYFAIAEGKNNLIFCNKIIEQEAGVDYKNLCYYKLATKNKDPTICTSISTIYPSKNDPSLGSTVEGYREMCINAAR